jgi:hypothetical protein
MPETRATWEQPYLRIVMMLIGACAGLAAWFLSSVIDDWGIEPRLYLVLASGTFAFFSLLLALVGPARLWPALPVAAGMALASAGLLGAASQRHEDVARFLDLGYGLAAFGVILLVATPFAAAALRARVGWRDYPTLFELSWRILVRFASAVIFTALFWGLVALSDSLLQLVGVRLMSWLQSLDALPWVLTGMVFGLAMGVVHEMRDYLSPYLVLRLLRLFVPVVLVVVAVFLVLLPVQGMSDLVGSLSAAGTLLSAALAGIVLITVAVDRDAREEVGAGWLRACVQALALLIPVLGALALYAMTLRVEQYGWTPARLMGACTGGVLTLYGLAYAGAVLARGPWAARIRQSNVVMALGIVVVSVLWLSPVLVPERIAAQSQLARYETKAMPVEDLPVEEMARDWGRAGVAALAEIEADPAVQARIADARRRQEEGRVGLEGAPLRAHLADLLPVQGGTLRPDMLAALSDAELQDWDRACARPVEGGPGCLLVLAEFAPGEAVTRGILFLNQAGGSVNTQAFAVRDGVLLSEGYVVDGAPGSAFGIPVSVLEALHRGAGRVAPAGMLTLQVDGRVFFPEN